MQEACLKLEVGQWTYEIRGQEINVVSSLYQTARL
jgi:hypothetical protein